MLTPSELAAQQAATDYACESSCSDLQYTRPSTQHVRVLGAEECSTVALPTPRWTTTSTATQGPPTTTAHRIDVAGSSALSQNAEEWPNTWTAVHWLAIVAPVVVLLCVCCFLYARFRVREKRKLSRVHAGEEDEDAESPAARPAAAGSATLDFAEVGGAITPEQIDGAELAIDEAERRAKKAGVPVPMRQLGFSAWNELTTPHFTKLARLLDKHPTVQVRLDLDWRSANDLTLAEVSKLLTQRRGRVRFNVPKKRTEECQLLLPLQGGAVALGNFGEALSVGGQHDIDAVVLQTAVSFMTGAPTMATVPLGPLRLSAQELVLNKQHLGDPGIAVACGFARPWAGRLVAARFLECDMGDGGAAEVARLLLGDQKRARNASLPAVANNLRELVLSANNIGDKGAAAIAEALPKCDSLERLLVDRNYIGIKGASALAKGSKRSGLRELVLGSHLGGNPVGPLGAEAMAGALDDELDRAMANRENRLQALNLEGCGVGIVGAKALSDALPKSAIIGLSIARCQLGDAGVMLILMAVPPGLMSLDLAGNSLTDEAALVVSEAMRRMPTLSVSLAQNELSPTAKAVLREEFGSRLRV